MENASVVAEEEIPKWAIRSKHFPCASTTRAYRSAIAAALKAKFVSVTMCQTLRLSTADCPL
jgi:hypothetical protein